MAKVIICIHGRSNKPEDGTLRNWWKNSVEEGLTQSTAALLGTTSFEMAYYADIHYVGGPVPDNENDEPYRKAKKGAIKDYQQGLIDRLRERSGNWLDNPVDWLEEHSHLFSALGRRVAKKVLEDLGEYYSDRAVRTRVNDRLRSLLVEHREDEIILVSHSMGCIVAYEVLRELGRSRDYPGFVLEHFVTMGSPLGLTVVKGNTLGTHGRLRTPSCVRGSWVNFSAPQDFVALDAHLADDYLPNSFGIQVRDALICNDYPGNEHKSYGYLRTPEFSRHLASLL
jgi:hypothetical protein